MSEETHLILGDAAIDATAEGRRGSRRRQKKRDEQHALTHCENCGAPLTGEYCAQCGQHAIDYRRSLWRVLIDAADSFLNWDTKFLSSVAVLLTRPWKLTNDFNAGRRARYVHPLRLYLLASIAFFLLARLLNFNSNDFVKFDAGDKAQIESALSKLAAPESGLDEAERAKVEEARTNLAQLDGNLSEKDKARMQAALGTLIASSVKQSFREKDKARLNKALDRVNAVKPVPTPVPGVEPPPLPGTDASPEVVPSVTPSPTPDDNEAGSSLKPDEKKDAFGRWIEARIKDRIGEHGTKSKLFLETLRNNIPTMMLCCIPLFALVLKLLYVGKRRFYVEHLVYALHIHTFVYVGVTVTTLLAMAVAQWSETARALISTALGCVMAVQVFLSIRRVYGQGWFFTTFKFLLGGVIYCFIIAFAVAATAFVTLLLPASG